MNELIEQLAQTTPFSRQQLLDLKEAVEFDDWSTGLDILMRIPNTDCGLRVLRQIVEEVEDEE